MYQINVGYDFGVEGYWWTIRLTSDGKFAVQMNGIVDKVCSTFERACHHMDFIKSMVTE